MDDRTKLLVMSLVVRFPTLLPPFEEHVADHQEILPQLFFADLERYAGVLFLKSHGDEASCTELRAILDELEHVYSSGDEELTNPIAVSFLEHLPRPNEPGGGMRELVGPTMAAQLKVIG